MFFVKNLVSRDKRNALKLNCKELNLPGKSEYRHIFRRCLNISYTHSPLTNTQSAWLMGHFQSCGCKKQVHCQGSFPALCVIVVRQGRLSLPYSSLPSDGRSQPAAQFLILTGDSHNPWCNLTQS